MYLRGQLFRAQFVCGDDLAGEGARLDKAEGIQRDFGNECVVGDHHCHGAEQCLHRQKA